MNRERLQPKILTTLKDYNWKKFSEDALAGVIVGIVALPLAIAFAIASGVSPDKGLVTAVIAGFLISVLGGSRVQIGGPTGAFVVIVYSIVQTHGVEGLIVATIMSGVMLIGMGFLHLGSVIKFIPHPLIVGFTSGIAVIIFSSQIKDFLGLDMGTPPADFVEKWQAYWQYLHTINIHALCMALACLALLILWPKYVARIPASLVVLLASTLAVHFFDLPIATIASRFGKIPSSLPAPHVPIFSLELFKTMLRPALSIALLGAIESLLSAVVADGMIGGRHRSNMELIAQGVANIVTPLFGGIPATGAIARTATNIKNGGRTPVAGIVHAITLLLIMIFLGQYAGLIPLPALAAILVIVSYNMSEWRSFRMLLKSPRADILVLLLTFGLTVFVDLTLAIENGMILSLFVFMHNMAEASNIKMLSHEMQDEEEEKDPLSINKKNIPPGVEVFEINGALFFGAAEKFKEAIKEFHSHPKVRILRMRRVLTIDATGLHVLNGMYDECKKNACTLVLSGVHDQPHKALQEAGLLDRFGHENVHTHIDHALKRAHEILAQPKI